MPWTNAELVHVATAVIALGALFRPDIERLIQRRRAIIDVHPAGRLEVGFSSFGPTIGVQGTLQAIHRDAFITYSSVAVVRVADNSRHEFPWSVFRPQTLAVTVQQSEIAAGFLLSVAAPRRFNIQFHDTGTADLFRQSLIDLQRLWTEYLQAEKILFANVTPGDRLGIYEAFRAAHLHQITPLYQVMDRQFYWIRGEYRMFLEVQTTRPGKTYTRYYTFSLSEAESDLLRLNIIANMRATCNLPDVIFNFAYPTYSLTAGYLGGVPTIR